MRLLPSLSAMLFALAVVSGCGTKTPLSLPPPAQPATGAAVPPASPVAPDPADKAAAEARR
jgi:predicted small lipoprotein YifL